MPGPKWAFSWIICLICVTKNIFRDTMSFLSIFLIKGHWTTRCCRKTLNRGTKRLSNITSCYERPPNEILRIWFARSISGKLMYWASWTLETVFYNSYLTTHFIILENAAGATSFSINSLNGKVHLIFIISSTITIVAIFHFWRHFIVWTLPFFFIGAA